MAPEPKPVPPSGDPQLNRRRLLAALSNLIVVCDGIAAICFANGNAVPATVAKTTSVVLQVIANLVRGQIS